MRSPLEGIARTLATFAGCVATFAGAALTSYGMYAVIQIFVTDDPKARDIWKGCAPLLLVMGSPLLFAGIRLLRRVKRRDA
jgi:hypothetical protein